jgi:hypothetical protein
MRNATPRENLGLHQAVNNSNKNLHARFLFDILRATATSSFFTTMFSQPVNTGRRSPLLQRLLSRHLSSSNSKRAFRRSPALTSQRYPSGYHPALNHGTFRPKQPGSSNRVKWARLSALVATCMGTGLGLSWIFFRNEVPITGRNRFNCLSDDWMLRNAHKWNLGALIADGLTQAARIKPTLLYPDNHPASLAARGIFDRLVEVSTIELGINPLDWRINIIAAPGESEHVAPV